MNVHDSEYLDTCKEILLSNRFTPNDRTKVGRHRSPGHTMRFHQLDGFPMLTSAKKSFKMVVAELEMFLKGITHNSFLVDQGVNIWTANAASSGDLGPIYGAMWRGLHESQPVDQLKKLMEDLRRVPESSRHLVTGWIPDLLPTEGMSYDDNVACGKQCLPPCHALWQVHVFALDQEERHNLFAERCAGIILTADNKTEEQWHKIYDAHDIPKYTASIQLYQRSADMFLGVPFNIASYSLLLHLICHSLNMVPWELIWNGGDCHIYSNHMEQMVEQVDRKKHAPPSPQLVIKGEPKNLWDYTADDIELVNYNPMPAIKGAMAS